MIEYILIGLLVIAAVRGFWKGGINELFQKTRLILILLFTFLVFKPINAMLMNSIIFDNLAVTIRSKLFIGHEFIAFTYNSQTIEIIKSILLTRGLPEIISEYLFSQAQSNIGPLTIGDAMTIKTSEILLIIISVVLSITLSMFISFVLIKASQLLLFGKTHSKEVTLTDRILGLLFGILKFSIITEFLFVGILFISQFVPMIQPSFETLVVSNRQDLTLGNLYYQLAQLIYSAL